MTWTIIMQEESVGKLKLPVRCKALRFFPMETGGGETIFKALAFPILQVIVRDGKGNTLKLKCNAGRGINNPEFTVQHPDTEEHPTMIVGEGKRRREVPDMLAAKVKKAGEKERYSTLAAFKSRVSPFLGAELTEEIISLFAARLAEIEQKRLAKSQKKTKKQRKAA